MKPILLPLLLFFSLIVSAQKINDQWAEVLRLEAEGELKQAANITDAIYKQAQAKHNEGQIVKTFFFRAKYMVALEENAQVKVIANLQSEIKKATPATAALLHYIYATTLHSYYMANKYTIDTRTKVERTTPENFPEWTGKEFLAAIKEAYAKSVENEKVLLKTPLANYEAVMDFNPHMAALNRPLYDFLAEQYVKWAQQNGELFSPLTLKVDTEKLFGTTAAFLSLNIANSKANTKGYQLLRDLETYYTKKHDKMALQMSVLRRLELGSNYYGWAFEKKTALFERLGKEWGDTPFAYRALYEAARMYNQSASKEFHPEYKVKALELLNTVIKNKDKSDVVAQAINMRNGVLQKEVSLQTERYITPGKPSLARVVFRNTDTLLVTVYHIPHAGSDKSYTHAELKKYPVAATQTYMLPNRTPHFSTSTEVILPALPAGAYVIDVVPSGFKEDEKADYHNMYTLISTNMAVTTDGYGSIDTNHYTVYDRETGAPLKGIQVSYPGNTYKTAEDGTATVNTTVGTLNQYEKVFFTHKGDTLSQSYYVRTKSVPAPVAKKTIPSATVALYTDRAIYRPGQKVFFKGVLYQYENDNKNKKIVPGIFVSITAEDDNGDEVATFRLKANEYGSFTGEFTLPQNRTGSFSLMADEDEDFESDPKYSEKKDEHPFWDNVNFSEKEIHFRVEEYKRPTFDVTFLDIKQAYRLNDSVRVTGVARSFSGAVLSGASVNYRVVREEGLSTYQRNDSYDDDYDEDDNDMDDIPGDDIDDDEITTDAQGRFTITFKAEDSEDPSDADYKKNRKYTYGIYADVTDINGETRRGNTSLVLGNYMLEPSVTMPYKITAGTEATVTLQTVTLNGQPLPAQGAVAVYKGGAPKRPFVQRPWDAPEVQTIPEADFTKLFPYFPYSGTATDSIVGRATPYFERNVNTATDKEIKITDFSGWPAGEYTLVFTAKDSTGKAETHKAEFALLRPEDILPADNALFDFTVVSSNYSKNGYIELAVRSAVPLLYGMLEVNGEKSEVLYNARVQAKGGLTVYKIPVRKKYTGNIKAAFSFVWNNQSFIQQQDIEGRQEAKPDDFRIEMENITSRLLPDSKQTWTVTLNSKNKKKEAELLASMYDASLDEFIKTGWESVSRPVYSYNYISLKSSHLITRGKSYTSYRSGLEPSGKAIISDDRLFMFGFDINSYRDMPLLYSDLIQRQVKQPGDYVISGEVLDEKGIPLPGATVVIKGTKEGVQTDFDGKYTIYVAPGETVQVSYVGFQGKTFTPLKDGTCNIALPIDKLGDVVVDSYRSVSRPKSASAVVTSKAIQNLEGQVAGVSISYGSGQPGANNTTVILRGAGSINGAANPLIIIDGVPAGDLAKISADDILDVSVLKNASATAIYGNRGANGVVIINTKKAMEAAAALKQVKARINFNETAFFYPQLHPDRKGNVSFSFTVPESLTSWKLRLLAHKKNTESAYLEKTFFTQKDLMVVPNMPRFVREGDTVTIKAKISNLTAEAKTGSAMLQLLNASTMAEADVAMGNIKAVQNFSLSANGNTVVSWTITIPEGMEGVQYKIVAKAGEYTDGEENILPVLPNRLLVTESLPLWLKPNTKKQYTFENFKNNTSATLCHQAIVLEYTSNPAWLALQSLPYLIEYEHECSEQTFARYYANSIAQHIMQANPKIAAVFEQWRKDGKASKMDNDPQLRNILLAETPWLFEMENKAERDKRIALLMDLNKLSASQQSALDKLVEKQLGNGAFPWFSGGEGSGYISRHILQGFGHLGKLGILSKADSLKVKTLINKGLTYADKEFVKQHQQHQQRQQAAKVRGYIWPNPYNDLHYLYMRSFYLKSHPVYDAVEGVIKPAIKEVAANWKSYTLYEKGMAALVLHRFGNAEEAAKVLKYLKGTSSNNTDWGMYWIENKAGWYWYKAPVETQALLIEAFAEVGNDVESADAMKVWLLKQKQNTHWSTTKATTEAVYALLMQGSNWLSAENKTTFALGDEKVLNQKLAETGAEAASGYVKLQWKPEEITKDMATLTVDNKSNVPGFGGVYWQYFEQADKIKPAQDGLMNIAKELYRKETVKGETTLKRITEKSPLKIGDLVTVRLVLTLGEDAEYVHLKDLRAAGFEPLDVLSGREYKGGLSYYRSTRDVATHFFFDYIKRGTYVLEYDVRVNNAGQFGNGITTLQSMYAPEFSGHTAGVRVNIEE